MIDGPTIAVMALTGSAAAVLIVRTVQKPVPKLERPGQINTPH